MLYKNDIRDRIRERLRAGAYSHSDHPLLGLHFVVPLLKYFTADNLILAEFEEDNKVICAFVISFESRFVANAYTDVVSQLSLSYIDESLSARKTQEVICSLFKALPKTTLAFNIEMQDPDFTAISKYAETNNAVLSEFANNTSIPPGIAFEDYWAERSKNIRKGTGRLIRGLERDGVRLEYSVVSCPSKLDDAFSEYCRLESTGWKAENGTAMSDTNTQGKFYKELITSYMQEGRAKVHQLKFDGEVTASLITIENDSMIIVIKTAYNESMSKWSPGRLIDYFMLKETLADGNAKSMENYTNASEQDQKWFPRVRQMYHVTAYRYMWLKWLIQLKQKLQS